MPVLDLRPREECAFDHVSLGEVMLRLDPGDMRVNTAREFRAWTAACCQGGPEGTRSRPQRVLLQGAGLHARIRQLHDHHRDRLADVLEACRARPLSAADALPILFKRQLDLHQTTFAMGEAIAHLHALWHRGKVRRAKDAEGVWRFSA